MIDIGVGGKVDVEKIHRLVRDDEILVGYPDGVSHPGTEIQNSDLARLLHFGSRRIPARPFLYQAIAEVRTELRNMIKLTIQKRIKENREPEGQYSLAGIGAFLVGAVQRFVRSDYYKSAQPNAPRTIARKGSDTPLIDTGFLVNSTTYVVRGGPSKVKEREVSLG